MAVDICPTVTAADPHAYREQMEKIQSYAQRVHIDLGDGNFTPEKLINIDSIWWATNLRADLHVMYERPFDHLQSLVALSPQLIIVHAEAEGDFDAFADYAHRHGIETGVALLPETETELIQSSLKLIDHVLIFSGNLGYQGGSYANLELLKKVVKLKSVKPTIEIGWDGGVNDQNISQLAKAGVDVLNVGGFLQKAGDQPEAYAKLLQEVNRATQIND